MNLAKHHLGMTKGYLNMLNTLLNQVFTILGLISQKMFVTGVAQAEFLTNAQFVKAKILLEFVE